MPASPEQLESLLTYCVDFARKMLGEAGDFYPFGATLSAQGELGAVGGHNGAEKPKPQDIYQLLIGAFKAGAGDGTYMGVALAANVNIPGQYESPSPDGIRVHIETQDYARFVYIPYRNGVADPLKKNRALELYTPFSVQIAPAFFKGLAPSLH